MVKNPKLEQIILEAMSKALIIQYIGPEKLKDPLAIRKGIIVLLSSMEVEEDKEYKLKLSYDGKVFGYGYDFSKTDENSKPVKELYDKDFKEIPTWLTVQDASNELMLEERTNSYGVFVTTNVFDIKKGFENEIPFSQ